MTRRRPGESSKPMVPAVVAVEVRRAQGRAKKKSSRADMPEVWRSRSHPKELPQGSQSRFGAERRRRFCSGRSTRCARSWEGTRPWVSRPWRPRWKSSSSGWRCLRCSFFSCNAQRWRSGSWFVWLLCSEPDCVYGRCWKFGGECWSAVAKRQLVCLVPM